MTIHLITDFTEASENALRFGCDFAKKYGFEILIINIFTIPSTYTGEGLSLASVNDLITANTDRLNDELATLRKLYPQLNINAELVQGSIPATLEEINNEFHPGLMLISTPTDYSELWTWKDDWLNVLLSVSCPVLLIPPKVRFKEFHRVTFACDYRRTCVPDQITAINKFLNITGASLDILHINTQDPSGITTQNSIAVQDAFKANQVKYILKHSPELIKAITQFIEEEKPDLLIAIPRKRGLWENFFSQSYAKQLSQLNNIPIMTVHGG